MGFPINNVIYQHRRLSIHCLSQFIHMITSVYSCTLQLYVSFIANFLRFRLVRSLCIYCRWSLFPCEPPGKKRTLGMRSGEGDSQHYGEGYIKSIGYRMGLHSKFFASHLPLLIWLKCLVTLIFVDVSPPNTPTVGWLFFSSTMRCVIFVSERQAGFRHQRLAVFSSMWGLNGGTR